jgi:4-amino-4-deoxychorismate lyase
VSADFLLNGNRRHALEPCDRGLQYGDGLFETLEVCDGSPLFWEEHYQRLSFGCQRLSIPVPAESLLRQEALALINKCQHGVLKIVITRGCGGRGYRPPEQPNVTRLLSLHPWPPYPDSLKQQGINLIVCRTRLGLNPDLAGLKHLNRLEQVLARNEWQHSDIQEGLMRNVQGEIIEGTMSNVFYVSKERLYTPNLHQSGVQGIVRNLVIALAKAAAIPVQEVSVQPEQLYTADEIFMTNSIIGIWPVKQLEQRAFTPGPITRQLQRAYQQRWQQQVNHV